MILSIHLWLLHSQEMLHLIAEQGRSFGQQEYANTLKLIVQSQHSFDIEGLLELLSQYFSVDNV